MHFDAFFIICACRLLLAAASAPAQSLNGQYFNLSCESSPNDRQPCSLDIWNGTRNLGAAWDGHFAFSFSQSQANCGKRILRVGLICAHCTYESLNFCRIRSDAGCFLTVCTNVIADCIPRWNAIEKKVEPWDRPEANNASLVNQKCGDQKVKPVIPNASSAGTTVATTAARTTREGASTTRKDFTPTTAPLSGDPNSSTSNWNDVKPKTLNGYYFNVSCEYNSESRGQCSYEKWQNSRRLGPVISTAVFMWHRGRCETFKYGLVCAHCTNKSQNFCHIKSVADNCFVVVCTNVIEDCVPNWRSPLGKRIADWPDPERHNKSFINQKCGDQKVKPVHATTSPTTTPVVLTPPATTTKGVSTTTEGSTPTASPLPTDPSSASSTATASTPNRNLMSYLLQEIINRQEQQTEILAGIREDIRKLKPVVNIGQVVNNARND